MGIRKGTPIPPGMERPPGLPTSPPPPKVASGEYYKAKIRELASWLANQEAGIDVLVKDASDRGQRMEQNYHSGRANMAFRAGAWISENIKGLK